MVFKEPNPIKFVKWNVATPYDSMYAGSASDLIKRVWEHKNSVIPGFTAKYNVHMLVYYEVHATYVEAARREKRLKIGADSGN